MSAVRALPAAAVAQPPRHARRPHGSAFGALGMLPFIALVFGFGGYAAFQVVQMAFSQVRVRGGQFVWTSAGFDNFRRVLADPVGLHALANTLVFVVATVVLSVLLGLVLALLVHRSVLLRGASRILVLWPAVVAPVVVSLIWLLILSPNIGLLNRLLGALALPEQQWLGYEVGAMIAVIILDVWHWTPVAFLLIYTSLTAIDVEIIEAAECDGASDWQVMRHVQVPLLLPALGVTALIRAVMSVKAFDEMYLLTHGGPNDATTLVSLHIRNVFFDQLNYGYGAAYSLVVVGLVACGVGLVVLTRSLAARRAVAP
jgi:multiple sugar transport system permease protein